MDNNISPLEMGTYKVRNEMETKRNQRNENEIKRNQRNQRKQNEIRC